MRGRTQVTLQVDAPSLTAAVAAATGLVSGIPHQVGLRAGEATERDETSGPGAFPGLLSVAQAAQEVGITRQSMLDHVKHHVIPAHMFCGRWLIPRAALEVEAAVARGC